MQFLGKSKIKVIDVHIGESWFSTAAATEAPTNCWEFFKPRAYEERDEKTPTL